MKHFPHPRIIQAPMAGSQGWELAAAVCRAGGVGSLPSATFTTVQLAQELTALQEALPPGAVYNLNFFCHAPPTPQQEREQAWREALGELYAEWGIDPAAVGAGPGRQPFNSDGAQLVEACRPPVVSFHFGLPEPALLQRVRATGAQVWSSATTVDEGLWLQAHGADAVIAQGLEAGGHRGHFLDTDPATALTRQMGTLALVPQLARALKVPVIAAGGIADAAGVRAALALGADAVQVGTAFLCADEARTSPVHRQALLTAAARHTALTRVFTGRPARGIVNRFMREMAGQEARVPDFPLATSASTPLRVAAEARGSGEFSPLWAGQNAASCRSAPAADIVRALWAGLG